MREHGGGDGDGTLVDAEVALVQVVRRAVRRPGAEAPHGARPMEGDTPCDG